MGSTTLTLTNLTNSGFKDLNPRSVDVIRQILTKDNFTAQLPALGIDGIANYYVRETTQATTTVFDVGDAVTESKVVDTKTSDECGRLVTQVSLDRKVAIGSNLREPWGRQLEGATWVMTQKWQNQAANGGGSSDGDITGLTGLADGAGSSQKYTPGTSTSGIAVALVHLDKIREKLQYPCDFYVMNEKLVTDIKVLMQSAGGIQTIEYQNPFASFNTVGATGSYEEIRNFRVPAWDGVPIFTNNYLTTETTNSGSGKYRIIAGSFAPGKGLEYFYPITDDQGMRTALGVQIDPLHSKESYDERFLRVVHMAGLSLYSTKAIAQGVNFKITNS